MMSRPLCNLVRFVFVAWVGQLVAHSIFAQETSALPKVYEANDQKGITRTVSGAKFEIPLTLYGASGQASSHVRIAVGPIVRGDGYVGKPASISSTSAGKDLEVPANAYTTLLLEGELPEFAHYRSWLLLTSGSESAIYSLTLERRPLQLSLLGAANDRLELSTSSRKMKVPLTFKLADGQADVSNLQLSVSSLAREDGRAIEREKLEVDQTGPSALKTGTFHTVHLVGSNMLPGKYWAKLTVRDDQSSQLFDVQMNCIASTQNITVVPVTSTSSSLWCWSAVARASLIVDESAGRLAEIYEPHVESIERLNDPTRPLNLANVDITVTHETDSHQSSQSAATEPLTTIAEHDSQKWTLTFGNLSAGRYKAKVAIAGPDLPKVVQECEIAVRHIALYAFPPLIIGVVISYLLQKYLQTGRASLVREVNLARVHNQLRCDEAVWPESTVWTALFADLSNLKQNIKVGKGSLSATDFEAALNDITQRRSALLSVLPKLSDLQAVLKAYPSFYQTERDEFRKKGESLLADVEGVLKNKIVGQQPLLDKLTANSAAIDALRDQARRFLILKPIQTLLKECQEFKALIVSDSRRAKSLVSQLTTMIDELAAMENSAKTEGLTGLEQRLNETRARYAQIRVQDLNEQLATLANIRDPAIAVTQWGSMDMAIDIARKALECVQTADPVTGQQFRELRIAALNTQLAQVEYLQVVVNNARPTDIDLNDWQEWIARENVIKHLKDARTAVQHDEPKDVLIAFQAAQTGYQNALRESIAVRVDNLVDLIQERPEVIQTNKWREVLDKADLKTATAELQKLKEVDTGIDPMQLQISFLRRRLKLLRFVVNACQSLVNPEEPHAKRIKSIQGKLAQAEQTLSAASNSQERLSNESLRAASAHLEQAQMEYTAFVHAAVDDGQGLVGQAVPRVSPSQCMVAPLIDMTTAPEATPSPPPPSPTNAPEEPDKIVRDIERADWMVSAVSLVLATLAGFMALYLPNAIWGTWADYLYAVLWGFGLNEASHGVLANLANKGMWIKAQA